MKKPIFIAVIVSMLLGSCWNDNDKPLKDTSKVVSAKEEPSEARRVIGRYLSSVDSATADSSAELIKSLKLKKEPYTSVAEIKKEIVTIQQLMSSGYDYDWNDFWEKVLCKRLKFHLSNPVTFSQWKAENSYNPLKVISSPDGKYKFYTTWDVSDGTMGHWITFYQYHDDLGNLVCKEWQDDRRFDCQGNVLDVWQFSLHDTVFYVLKKVWKASSHEWGYSMEVATFENGVPRYHIRFFPDMKEYGEIKKFEMVNGKLEEGDWIKEDGSYGVCYTSRALDVNYTFDPKTLTVTATTQDDNADCCKTETWKLKTR